MKKSTKKKNTASSKRVSKEARGNKSFLNPGESKSNKILLLALRFFAIFFVLSFIVETMDLSLLTNWIASILGSSLGLNHLLNVIYVNDSIFVVSNMCTGLTSICMLAAIIFSLNKPSIAKKFILFVVGSVVLFLVNLPRIVFVLIMARNGFDPELVHELTWFVMSIIVLFIWYYGTKSLTTREEFKDLA